MKILFSLPNPAQDLSDTRGASVRVRELLRGFEQKGHQTVVAAARDSGKSPVEGERAVCMYRKGVGRLLPAPLAVTLRDIGHLVQDWLYTKTLERIARENQPDFLIETYAPFHQSGVTVGERLNIPVIIEDIPPTWEGEVYFARTLKGLARRIERTVFSKAAGLVAVSEYLREDIRSKGVPEDKIGLVHNGVDCGRFHPGISGEEIRERYGLRDKLVVGFVGGFLEYHGLDLLLEAAEQVSQEIENLHLLLIGDGKNTARHRGRGSPRPPQGQGNVYWSGSKHRHTEAYRHHGRCHRAQLQCLWLSNETF